MPQRDKDSFAGDLLLFSGLHIPHLDPVHIASAVNLRHHRVPHKLDLGILLRPFRHDLRGAQTIPPMNHRHLRRKPCQKAGLLHRGISSADHHHRQSPIERSVTGRARRDPAVFKALLRFQADPARTRSRRHDQRPAFQRLPRGQMQNLRSALFQLHRFNGLTQKLHIELLRLLLHLRHQFIPVDRIRKTRKVLDLACLSQQSPRKRAGDNQRIQIRPAGIQRRRQSRRSGTHNNQISHLCYLVFSFSLFLFHFALSVPEKTFSASRFPGDPLISADGRRASRRP